jgi:hypothetical protein
MRAIRTVLLGAALAAALWSAALAVFGGFKFRVFGIANRSNDPDRTLVIRSQDGLHVSWCKQHSAREGKYRVPSERRSRKSLNKLRFQYSPDSWRRQDSCVINWRRLRPRQVSGPRWTVENRQFVDRSKPAISRRSRPVSSTSFLRQSANRSALSCASSAVRTSARAHDGGADRGVR